MDNPLTPFEQLWDEDSLRAEIEEFFGEFDPVRWSLGGGMVKPFEAHLESGEDPVEFYRDEIGYVYQSGWNCATNDERSKYAVMRDYALAHGYTSAIDVGCGSGSGVIALALAGLEKVVAMDVCKPSLDFVKARAKRFGLDNVKFVDLYPTKWTRHKADLVICTEVFEHVVDPIALAHKIFKMVNPGGAMIASWSFVDMVGHLPQHFHLAARHPDQWQTEGFGLILIDEVGFVFDKWTWFNNTAWKKPDEAPTPPAPEPVIEATVEEVEVVVEEEPEEVVEPVVEEVYAEEFGSALGSELIEEVEEEDTPEESEVEEKEIVEELEVEEVVEESEVEEIVEE